jgi:hypothetical protein
MPLPRALTVEECKLLQKDDLVERYRQFRTVLETVETTLGDFAKRPAFASTCEELDQLAVRMSRDRYRIGFLGVSQAGKSTTAGCVVDAVEAKDNPAPPGGKGKAATAVATRIRPVRSPHTECPPGEKHHVQLLFLTEEQFNQRVKDIFGILDLTFDETAGTDAWLDALNAHGTSHPTTSVDDRDTAIRLIHARRKHGELLKPDGDSPATKNGSFDLDARRSYVVHPDDDTQSETLQYALLREMRIWYCTDGDKVPVTLELIDLPGLGVERESDEALTTAFLKELDGAFLFSDRQQLTGKPAATLAKHLRQQFGETLSGRMWLVATFMHELQDLDDVKGTIKTLDEQVTKHGFVKENVVFVATGVFQALNDRQEPSRTASIDAWKACKPPAAFHPEYDDNNELIIPPAIQAFAAFREAYRGLAVDGGISRIRNLMTKNVEADVRRQTQEHAVDVMNRLIQALSKDLAASRQMGGMSHEQMVDAAKAASAIEVIAESLRRPHQQVDGIAEDIIASLGELLEELFENRTTDPTKSDNASCGNALKRQGIVRAKQVITDVVKGVRDDVEALTNDCSAMSVETIKAAIQKWRDDCSTLETGLSPKSGTDFSEQCLSGLQMQSGLVDEMWSDGRGPSIADYRGLMEKKIVLVAHEFVSRLAKELADAMAELSGRMRSVGDESAAANPVHLESIKMIEGELHQLQAT